MLTFSIKQNAKVIEIQLNGEALIEVDIAFKNAGIAEWEVDSREQFFELFGPLEQKVALTVAMRKLTRQALHSKKLAQYLKGRHFGRQAIDFALETLRRLGAINDVDVTVALVERLKRKNKSSRYIAQKCALAGASSEEYAPLLEGEQEQLRRLISKRYPRLLEEDTPFLERQKAKNALFRQGFSPQIIACVLNDE